MATVKGNSVLVYIDNVAIGCLTGCTFTSNGNTIDTTCKDNDGAPESLPSKGPWSISFNGNFKTDSVVGLEQLLAIRRNLSLAQLKFGGDNVGDLYIIGQGYLNQLTWDGPLNAASTFSGQFDGSGDWEYDTAS